MYRIKGSFPGSRRKLEIEWDDGVITGDDDAVFGLITMAETAEDIGFPGMRIFSGMAILGDGTATWVFINRIMDDVEIILGKLPKLPKTPKGSIQ